MLDGFQHRLLRDLVEHHTVDVGVRLPDLVGDVPRDGLALAIRVGRKQDPRRLLGRGFDLRDDLLLAVDDDVLGLEIMLDIDADGGLGQVLHVSDRSLHLEPWAQVLLDGAGLGWRFDDHQRSAGALRRTRGLGLRSREFFANASAGLFLGGLRARFLFSRHVR